MSATPLIASGATYSYDFTTGAEQAYGGIFSQKEIAPGVWGMKAGNGIVDSQINNSDKNESWYVDEGSTGYFDGDFNMDSQVNANDKNTSWAPNSGEGSKIPE
ncbi:MAG: hypothetical protein H8D45_09930 [Bacteroidetes bacterium]|nr:hypothetical protein [Bacteroidota bacterium]MBL7105054.1 hypothetical protein [Bacteroidales bacterium]